MIRSGVDTRMRPTYIVFQLPGSNPYQFKLDDKGSLCMAPGRTCRSTSPYDQFDANCLPPLPTYKVIDQKIFWGSDAAKTDAPGFPSPSHPHFSRQPPDETQKRSFSAPIRQTSPPAPQFASPVGIPPASTAEEDAIARANRITFASSPFNPSGPFHPHCWSVDKQ
jgi:hypothetical protein